MTTYKNRDYLKSRALEIRKKNGFGYQTIQKILLKEFGVNVHWSTIRNWTQVIIVDAPSAYKKAIERAKAERWPTRKESIRKRLLDERGNKCESCGLTEWLDKPITLEMHRILGGGLYIRENVLLLCPNCHAQTDTWRNKSRTTGEIR